ncbi:hypothetical protein Vadar_027771 [Vaccinium darrowii]|uniref:Uncharacterized protein n=1 Tax=Vaccinium darrowii TaxID=229202 RepID=A0ACB7YYR2_9ERIC|nr:hypothetical protein Vadar_027771 [Vaccinium darrowii]
MVGLSVVLDSTKLSTNKNQIKAQVINKADMIKSSPPSSTQPSPQPPHPFSQWKSPSSDGQVTAAGAGGSFLDQCFLCKQKILLGKDIFMYKGDRAFCSEECRCRHIFMDDNFFPLPAIKQPQPPTSSSSPSPSSPNQKAARNRANRFAY